MISEGSSCIENFPPLQIHSPFSYEAQQKRAIKACNKRRSKTKVFCVLS